MGIMGKAKLSSDPYKGVRDFYPEEMRLQNHILDVMRKVAESFGYEEYGASVLEPADLYRAKSGEEIVKEQTYTFKDRGEREVTLRPEMTPTLARMVAAKRKSLFFPLRWYSIPNLFRYEQPQKGRLREHWQLNADIFGIAGIEAETEVISLASAILGKFGLKPSQFEIRINNRKIIDYIFRDLYKLGGAETDALISIVDKRAKISPESLEKRVSEFLGDKTSEFLTLIGSKNFEEFIAALPQDENIGRALDELKDLTARLERLGITNVIFDQSLVRGFDYYTGIVFEIFDTDPDNRRSLFGGGRYDRLLESFGAETSPAVGFGMGDVTIRETLKTHNLIPKYRSLTDLYICVMEKEYLGYAMDLAEKLRGENLAVALDYSFKKVGDQVKYADRKNIPFVICIGEKEASGEQLKVKELSTGVETVTDEEKLSDFLKKMRDVRNKKE